MHHASIQIPPQLRETVTRIWGDTGRQWLESLPELLDVCVSRWRLSNLAVPDGVSINMVCFADSPDYGAVVLKMGVPHPDLFTEMTALTLYGGRFICICHDMDRELGAMLLERIVPGTDLRSVQDIRERIRIAGELMAKLPIPAADADGLPTSAELADRAFARARAENRVGDEMLALMAEAGAAHVEIAAADRPRVLLHGDLHHMNILLDRHGQWKAIDPKGIIGARCQETARFIENQLDMVDSFEVPRQLEYMIAAFSDRLGETKRMIALSLLADMVLSTCWSVEDNVAPEEIRAAIKRCRFCWDYAGAL